MSILLSSSRSLGLRCLTGNLKVRIFAGSIFPSDVSDNKTR